MNSDNCITVDLTRTLHPNSPNWDGGCGFQLNTDLDYKDGARVQSLNMCAGIGTHMDAPSHFIPDGSSIADIPIQQLICPAVVVDVNPALADYFITTDDIEKFEKQSHTIKPNTLVLFHTGWGRYWDNPDLYRNEDANHCMHFPGVSPEATELLLERDISGIAIDTLSPDGGDLDFPVHHLLLGHGKYIIENIANLEKLPATGAHVIALPLKIDEGTEAPCRVIGLLENNKRKAPLA